MGNKISTRNNTLSDLQIHLKFFCFVLASGSFDFSPPAILEKTNMFLLSREATDKDKSLKTQRLILWCNYERIIGEMIWKENGFFDYQKFDFTISTKYFPKIPSIMWTRILLQLRKEIWQFIPTVSYWDRLSPHKITKRYLHM